MDKDPHAGRVHETVTRKDLVLESAQSPEQGKESAVRGKRARYHSTRVNENEKL